MLSSIARAPDPRVRLQNPVLARGDGEVVDGPGLFLASKRYRAPHRPLLKGPGSIVTVFSVLSLVRQALELITVGLVLGMADR